MIPTPPILNNPKPTSLPHKGVGLGLRSCHYSYIETEKPAIDWFEILTDNYLHQSGLSLHHLEKILNNYPVTLHGVGMSLGGTDPLNKAYFKKLKSFIKRTHPLLVSDHLCWTSFKGQHFHELLPLPYTDESLMHVAKRIQHVQDYLGQQIMIENASSYLKYTQSTLNEWEYLQAVANEADCLILLDINNVYVSAFNNEFNPLDYIKGLSNPRIAQFHLAGFSDHENHLLDTHSAPVHQAVWQLYEAALKQFGPIPTTIEWDTNIPSFPVLQREAQLAKNLMETYVLSS